MLYEVITAGISDNTEWTFTTGSDYALAADDDLASNDDYIVYPNPFDDVIYISNSENISRLYFTNVVGVITSYSIHYTKLYDFSFMNKQLFVSTICVSWRCLCSIFSVSQSLNF